MTTVDIVSSIDAEIAKLQRARAELTGGAVSSGGGVSSGGAKKAAIKPRRKHVMSAEARAKIAAAQKARWAKQKKAAKKA
jgi:hypothetical protein